MHFLGVHLKGNEESLENFKQANAMFQFTFKVYSSWQEA